MSTNTHYRIMNETLTDMADAIREKTGSDALLTPYQMTGTIRALAALPPYTSEDSGKVLGIVGGDLAWVKLTGGEFEAETYTVTQTLSHVTSSNSAATVELGSAYTVTFTPEAGHAITAGSVTMDGRPLEIAPDRDSATGAWTYVLPSVTGNLAFTVTASTDVHTITYDLTRVASSNTAAAIAHGAAYTTTFTADEGCTVRKYKVTMGGEVWCDFDDYGDPYFDATINEVTGDVVFTLVAEEAEEPFTIISNLAHATLSNPATTAAAGSSYAAAVTPAEGYVLKSVNVAMGGVLITETAYADGISSIPSVTGNIVITVLAEAENTPVPTHSITYVLTHVTSSNTASAIEHGQPFTTTFTADEGYTVQRYKVTMGGEVWCDFTDYGMSTFDLTVNEVTGDVVFTLAAEENVPESVAVTNNIFGATTSNPAESVPLGSSYTAAITPNEGCVLKSVSVAMDGTLITDSVYADGVIHIPNVTGLIVITVFAKQVFTITHSLTNCTSSNAAATILEHDAYSAVISANSGCQLGAVTVTMGGEDVTASAYSDGQISISSVTGNLVITAAAQAISYTVTTSATGCIIGAGNGTVTVAGGSSFKVGIQVDSGNTITSLTVTMGGQDITSTAWDVGYITIPNVTGNVTISAKAMYIGTTHSLTMKGGSGLTLTNAIGNTLRFPQTIGDGGFVVAHISGNDSNIKITNVQVLVGSTPAPNTSCEKIDDYNWRVLVWDMAYDCVLTITQ